MVRLPSQEDLKRAELLRNATAEKQDDIEKAIESLRCAYTLIRDPEAEPIETYLRLPLYLQQGGRFDEAWFEANKLLKEFRYSRAKLNREVLPMDRSTIYDKMRLMLQREKRFEDAVLYAILSHVSWAIGLSRQRGRGIELKDTCDKETIGLMLKQPLKKAKLADREEPLVNLLCERLRSAKAIAVIDLDVLATEIRSVIEPPKPR
ncbi:MAG TPA: hypothetical protein VJX67_08140 [Blastocatellia bacterium]|nr:hypothetical protein [Blastocatellia bacterium]